MEAPAARDVKAGFHAVAPDLRGYGKSDKPADVEAYDVHHLTGDVVGLIDALGEKTAVVPKAPASDNCGTMYQGSATSPDDDA